jgi:hypothetical protein
MSLPQVTAMLNFQGPKYEPTPQEIAIATAEIRRNWTESEYRRRAGVEPSSWSIPEVAVIDLLTSKKNNRDG